MTTKHTPGPWFHVGGHDKRTAPYIRKVGDPLPGTAAVAQVCGRGNFSENEANARLIAAAPELLAALERAFLAFGRAGGNTINGPFRKEWEDARAAIAKATGK